MGSNTQLSNDLIKEMLVDIFLKKTILDKPNSIIQYNRDYLLSVRPQSSTEPIYNSLRETLKSKWEDIKAKRVP